MKITRLLLIILCSCLSASCTKKHVYDIGSTLAEAGSNRTELEKVLAHFRDSGRVAYESACFLIENLKYHSSKDLLTTSPLYAGYFNRTDSLYHALFDGMTPEEANRFKGKEYDSLRAKSIGRTIQPTA